jgi:hypothetical protein
VSNSRGRVGLVALVAILILVGLYGLRAKEEAEAGPTLAPEELLRQDDRLRVALAPCAFGQEYNQDTTDMAEVLAQCLYNAQKEPLHAAKAELAAMGARAVPALRRLAGDVSQNRFEHGVLENILGVCTLMEGGEGADILRQSLTHPQETVRMASIEGLRRHGDASDYESIVQLIPLTSQSSMRGEIVRALGGIDVERLAADFATWMETGIDRDIWRYAAPIACATTNADTIARLKALGETAAPNMQPFLFVAAARNGDEAALEGVRKWLEDPNPSMRQVTLKALQSGGLASEANSVLQRDLDVGLRLSAAEVLAAGERTDETHAWLTAGLSDADMDVRRACMAALVQRSDARAISEALALLKGTQAERRSGIAALIHGWDKQPGLADRTFDLVTKMLVESEGRTDNDRLNLLQVLGQIPGRRTAEALLKLARTQEGKIHHWSAHRWLVFRIANAGPEAQAYLMEQLAEEDDLTRRIDLLWVIAMFPTDGTRELFKGILSDPETAPLELVYSAQCLVEGGPAEEVAPFLKRITFGTKIGWVRRALTCLLWIWYG